MPFQNEAQSVLRNTVLKERTVVSSVQRRVRELGCRNLLLDFV